jgi:anti-sigma factor (TIGR02949 family)
MSGRAIAVRCTGVAQFIDLYLDGEFGERERMEFEAHLGECESCRRKVKMQGQWRSAIRQAAPREPVPAALRSRISQQLALETHGPSRRRRLQKLAVQLIPYGMAAVVASSFLLSRIDWSPISADVIAKHQRNLPIEISGGNDQVRRWYADKVDFPVHLPSFAKTSQTVALRGGRLTNVRDRQAAYLVYDVDGNKVSVFIFDPGKLILEARRKQLIGNREVYFDDERGYHVALYRDEGVGYAIASDLGQEQMMKLVSAAVSR